MTSDPLGVLLFALACFFVFFFSFDDEPLSSEATGDSSAAEGSEGAVSWRDDDLVGLMRAGGTDGGRDALRALRKARPPVAIETYQLDVSDTLVR